MNQLKPPYKDKQNRWLTQALFYEPNLDRNPGCTPFDPIFTLYSDRPGLISGRKTFVELRDPTGRRWAEKYLGDWEHWLRLLKAPWFQTALEVWQAELREVLRSEAFARIYSAMDSENPAQSLAAAKFIATEEFHKDKAGRPSKEKLHGELKRAVEQFTIEDEDMERMGLKVIKGGKGGN